VYIGGVYEKALKTGEVTKYYSLGGRRVAMSRGGATYYLASDHLGGTSLVMDANGAQVSRVRYLPYGQVWTQSAPPATDKLFTGHTRLGARSGLYYAGARFYSADLGRFLSVDSIVPGAGDPQALNRYAYAYNSPAA
jgi:RHS repeat-associated protein